MRDDTLELDIFAPPILEERPWAVFAACRGEDPDLFFGATKEAVARALSLCGICPVETDCREYALSARERFGIWGGLTERERRRLLRRRP